MSDRRYKVSEKRKLTVEQVAQICQQYKYGRRTKAIAAEFGVSRYTVWKVTRGRRKGTYDIRKS